MSYEDAKRTKTAAYRSPQREKIEVGQGTPVLVLRREELFSRMSRPSGPTITLVIPVRRTLQTEMPAADGQAPPPLRNSMGLHDC